MKLTEQEKAVCEWFDHELTGVKSDASQLKLAALAATVGIGVERARAIYRAHRYEEKFRQRHFRVPESTYDPAALAEMIDGETFSHRMGWGEVNGEEQEAGAGRQESGDRSRAAALAAAAGVLLEYLKPALLKCKVVWKCGKERLLREGESVEEIEGAGSLTVRGTEETWLGFAVVIRNGDVVVKVFPEAKVKQRLRRKSGVSLRLKQCVIVGEKLNYDELCRRFAAMLRLYQGSASGLRSQVHVAAVADVTKQAVNDMELRMAQQYRRDTGGRAHFENVRGKGPSPKAKTSNSKHQEPKKAANTN